MSSLRHDLLGTLTPDLEHTYVKVYDQSGRQLGLPIKLVCTAERTT